MPYCPGKGSSPLKLEGTCNLSNAAIYTWSVICPYQAQSVRLIHSKAPADTIPLLKFQTLSFPQAAFYWLAHHHRHHSFLKASRSRYDSPSFSRISITAKKRTLRCSSQREAGGPALLGICWFRLLALERYWRSCRAACRRGGSPTYQSSGFH